MALPANTFATYDAIGNREDLSDVIYRIDPTDTPFMSGVAKVKASAVLHEWQTQSLATAVTTNAVIEGNDAVTDAATATVRLSNTCQIMDKVARVTGTQQAVNKAGRSDELAYQKILKGLELKRDMESTLLTNQAEVTGDSTTARKFGSVLSWIATNDVLGASGVSPSGNGNDTRTDGTQRAFTEALLKTTLQNCWTQGGNPNTIMVGAFNKQVMSSFVGRGTPFEDTKSKKIIAAVEVYESDFGTLKVVANRFQRARDCLVLEMKMWALAYLRNMKTVPLAKTGDSERSQVICEFTLESRNEAASGGVFDLTTS